MRGGGRLTGVGAPTDGGDAPLPGRRGPGRLAILAVVILAVAATAVILLRTGGGGDGSPKAGAKTSADPARFDLPALIGAGHVRLDDFAGKPLVLNFFASWCTACRGELPGFLHVQAGLGGAVAFAGVNSLETGDGPAFAREEHIASWPLARDVGGTQASGLHDALGGQGLPITAFYDASGKLLKVHLGAISEDGLRELLRQLDRVG